MTSYSQGLLSNAIEYEVGESTVQYVIFGIYIYGEGDPQPGNMSAIMGVNEGDSDSWSFTE